MRAPHSDTHTRDLSMLEHMWVHTHTRPLFNELGVNCVRRAAIGAAAWIRAVAAVLRIFSSVRTCRLERVRLQFMRISRFDIEKLFARLCDAIGTAIWIEARACVYLHETALRCVSLLTRCWSRFMRSGKTAGAMHWTVYAVVVLICVWTNSDTAIYSLASPILELSSPVLYHYYR